MNQNDVTVLNPLPSVEDADLAPPPTLVFLCEYGGSFCMFDERYEKAYISEDDKSLWIRTDSMKSEYDDEDRITFYQAGLGNRVSEDAWLTLSQEEQFSLMRDCGYETPAVRVAEAKIWSDDTPLELLREYFVSRIGMFWPREFCREGIMSREDYECFISSLEQELDDCLSTKCESDSKILTVAKDMGYTPDPGNPLEEIWKVNCPGTNHSMHLNPELNEFFCGYCNRSGGIDAYGKFVFEREPDKSNRVSH